MSPTSSPRDSAADRLPGPQSRPAGASPPLATTVSEIARNALRYARGGTVHSILRRSGERDLLFVDVHDR